MLCASVRLRFAELVIEELGYPFCDRVNSVVVVSVFREFSLGLKVNYKSALVLYGRYLCVLYRTETVGQHAESAYTERHKTSRLYVVQRHHKTLVGVFIVHIVYNVHRIDVKLRHPRCVRLERRNYLIVVKDLLGKGLSLGSDLLAVDLVASAVERHKKHLCKVTSRTEELHLLTRFHCGNTASDRIVVSEITAHNVVVFVLNRVGIYRNLCAEALEAFRKILRPENRDVRLCARSEVIKRLEEAVAGSRDHCSAVLAHTCKRARYPYGISREEIIIFGSTQVADETHLDNEIVYKLLCVNLVKRTLINITLNINIDKRGDTSDTVCRTVLLLDCSEISEIEPLYCLVSVFCGTLYIASVLCSHLNELSHKVELLFNILNELNGLCVHIALADALFILYTLVYKVIHTVKGNSAVVSDNSSSAVSIGKSGKNARVPCLFHGICICSENTGVMRGSIFEFVMDVVAYLVSVRPARLNGVSVSRKGVYRSFKGLVSLKSEDYILAFNDISRSVRKY